MFDVLVKPFGKLWWALRYIEVVGFHKSRPRSHFIPPFLYPFPTTNQEMNHDQLSKISNYIPQNRRSKIQIYRQIHLEIKVCLLSIIFFNVYYSLAHDQIIEFLWLFRTLAVGLFSQLLKPKKIRQNW